MAMILLPAILWSAAVGPGRAWSQETPSDLRVDETKHKSPILPSLRQFGSFGPSLGMMKVLGGDLGSQSQANPVMQGVFRYRFSDNWIGEGEFGFGWNNFKSQGDTVLAFTFGTLGAMRRFAHRFDTDFRGGAGAGMYRWDYKYHGKALRDRFRAGGPDSLPTYGGSELLYKGFVPGGFLGLEAERRMARHVTLTLALQQHMVFTSNSKFLRLFNRNYSFTSFRIGANYHFSPTEGILWERKQNRVIRLESGKAGS